jgi:hypothetical protein
VTGHESGQLLPPASWTWADVVDHFVAERGSLAELVRHLLEIAPLERRGPVDPMTLERGLRRLRQRGHREGNTYGRLLLQHLGLPGAMQGWAQELGQYHSRSSDLPLPQRIAQLERWDRPPVSESPAAIWVHIGLASVAHRREQPEAIPPRLNLIRLLLKRATPAARAEAWLLLARLSMDAPEPARALEEIAAAEVATAEIADAEDRACYVARACDQRAYIVAQGWRDEPQRLQRALALYDLLADSPAAPPFARFRRAHGRAWCLWRLQALDEAAEAARLGIQHAGDGGFVRFRSMGLGLLANILGSEGEGAEAAARAREMARRLGDAQLRMTLPEG